MVTSFFDTTNYCAKETFEQVLNIVEVKEWSYDETELEKNRSIFLYISSNGNPKSG